MRPGKDDQPILPGLATVMRGNSRVSLIELRHVCFDPVERQWVDVNKSNTLWEGRGLRDRRILKQAKMLSRVLTQVISDFFELDSDRYDPAKRNIQRRPQSTSTCLPL